MTSRYALALLLGFTVLAYASTWRAGFVYEDIRTVISNGEVQQVEPWHWHELRSLSVLSFRINHAIDGNNPRGYHAVNVAVHLVNGVLVYAIASALLEPIGALTAAMLFLLSPLQSEAVAYVSGRTELLAGLSVLAALWLATQPPKLWHLVGIPLVLSAGLLAKETAAVGFPIVALAYALQYPGILGKLRENGDIKIAGTWIVALGSMAVWVLWPLRHLSDGATGSERGVMSYIAIQCSAMWRYLAMVVWPQGLTIDHDYDLISHPLAYAMIPLTLLLPIAAWWLWKRAPVQALGIATVFVALVPRFLIRIPEYLNEHQMYVPMLGVSLFVGATVQHMIPWLASIQWTGPQQPYWDGGPL